MALTITHAKVSGVADGVDPAQVQASDWNAGHMIQGTLPATTVEKDLGATASWRGRFTITDATITATSKVHVWQAPGPYTGKGTRADEAELARVCIVMAEPAAGSAVVTWETPPVYVPVLVVASGRLQSSATGATRMTEGTVELRRRGLVCGNVKFSYVVHS